MLNWIKTCVHRYQIMLLCELGRRAKTSWNQSSHHLACIGNEQSPFNVGCVIRLCALCSQLHFHTVFTIWQGDWDEYWRKISLTHVSTVSQLYWSTQNWHHTVDNLCTVAVDTSYSKCWNNWMLNRNTTLQLSTPTPFLLPQNFPPPKFYYIVLCWSCDHFVYADAMVEMVCWWQEYYRSDDWHTIVQLHFVLSFYESVALATLFKKDWMITKQRRMTPHLKWPWFVLVTGIFV